MRIAACTSTLCDREATAIFDTMARILAEVGVRVESRNFLDRLASFGGEVDYATMRVTFCREFIDRFVAESDKFDWSNVTPQVSSWAGVYQGYYLDPDTDKHVPWTEKRLADYAKLAYYLDHVTGVSLLGCPFEGIDRRVIPLYHRLMCWKYGMAQGGGSIWDTRLCPYILDMCQLMAQETGRGVKDFFRGMVFLTSTLNLPETEAQQFLFFAERGLPVSICNMTSAGGSGPVTLAGALAVHLAQNTFGHIVSRAFFGDRSFDISTGIAPYDMRTLIYAYGRPEIPILALMAADVARKYGVASGASCGSADAKRPGPEAGVQKVFGVLPALLATGHAAVNAGVLSVDEIGSPIQMILDNECMGALKRFAMGSVIDEETLALDVIKRVGPGGIFIDDEHTVQHFRQELWSPEIWTREMFSGWQAHGARSEIDIARDRFHEIMERPRPTSPKAHGLPMGLSESTENKFKAIIARASAML